MRKALAALAALFLLAHLFYLPPTLEDIDSVNFALGVRDFDVARHQPHPPGYPVFVALGKISTPIVQWFRPAGAASSALGLLSAIAGAVCIPLLFWLFTRLGKDEAVAWWAMAVAVCSPLFWFPALRPLSDMTGLACAIASQGLVLSAVFDDRPRRRPALVAGAVLCGLAAGIRIQTVLLTGPLLVAALAWPRSSLPMRDRTAAIAACALGTIAWAVPLIVSSGGPGGYLAALGTQAGEDFSGVVMLWTTRQARVAADAVLNSFVWPWKDVVTGTAVIAVAMAGLVRFAWRLPGRCVLLLIAFGPYEIFHLLFHETVTMRYALPLVPPVAFLMVYGAAGMGRIAGAATAAAVIASSLAQTVPAARAYARDGSPAFRAFRTLAAAEPAGDRPVPALAMHATMRRVEAWEGAGHGARVIRSAHGHEWLALVELWRSEPDADVRFLADPRRTDLALLDPHARALVAAERWTLPQIPFIAGTRPGAADAYSMRPPGWMLDRGWALTAETGGVTERDGAGPHNRPSVAWIRARSGAADLIVGGRHLGSAGDPPARVTIAGDRGAIDAWDIRPGFFFRRVAIPAGTLDGSGYVPLRFGSTAADGSGRTVRVALEQFDLQPDGTVMFGFVDGWYEPEYNPRTSQAWRWMSEQGRLWIRPIGRDVVLTLSGESPLKYFDKPPAVRVSAAGTELGRAALSSDFTERITVPAAALLASGGIVTVDTDLWFSPAERGESPDERHLALRVYRVTVE